MPSTTFAQQPSPVTLAANGVSLVPLTHAHAAGLESAATDGALWELRVTSVPEPGQTSTTSVRIGTSVSVSSEIGSASAIASGPIGVAWPRSPSARTTVGASMFSRRAPRASVSVAGPPRLSLSRLRLRRINASIWSRSSRAVGIARQSRCDQSCRRNSYPRSR